MIHVEPEQIQKKALERKIYNVIKSDNGCETYVEFEVMETMNKGDITNSIVSHTYLEARAITYNPIKQESFLLVKVIAENEMDGLRKVLDYILTHRSFNYSHTLTWSNKKDGVTKTSYFYAKDAMEALEKFYHDKDRGNYIVYNVKLNPIS